MQHRMGNQHHVVHHVAIHPFKEALYMTNKAHKASFKCYLKTIACPSLVCHESSKTFQSCMTIQHLKHMKIMYQKKTKEKNRKKQEKSIAKVAPPFKSSSTRSLVSLWGETNWMCLMSIHVVIC